MPCLLAHSYFEIFLFLDLLPRFCFFFIFFVADTQLYKSLCPSVGPSVRQSVRPSARVEKCENAHFRPCPPVRNWYGRVSGLVSLISVISTVARERLVFSVNTDCSILTYIFTIRFVRHTQTRIHRKSIGHQRKKKKYHGPSFHNQMGTGKDRVAHHETLALVPKMVRSLSI